ncbi:hypothetical protein BDSB_08695 [Burkholderia dolosa PC543]|nr:hypothetical protein BDSB_08695 [Burkholderia dolosa PC543]
MRTVIGRLVETSETAMIGDRAARTLTAVNKNGM